LHPELFWLPEPTPSWTAALAALPNGATGTTAGNTALAAPALPAASEMWPQLVELANHRLDGLATIRLDRRLTRLFGPVGKDHQPPPGLSHRVRLAVLASATAEHLLPGIRVAGLRRGMWISTYLSGYGQYAQELLDPRSALHAFRPTAVLFALDAHHIVGTLDAGATTQEVEARLTGMLDSIARQWELARSIFGCTILQQTFPPVFPALFGGNEHRLPGSPAAAIAGLNARLRERADAEGADLVALDDHVARDGLAAWHDPVLWHRAKQEVHPAAAAMYGELVARLLAAQQGRAFKCLALDLDNTLWGGVIGDDGLTGITLGQGSALGEAFAAFQRYARDLARRGVILAVCSKNDEANALEPFEKHPEMVLRREDIACFAANWTDKASNLREIAEQLNIGLDAVVFADDNPFERNIVRRELPMVAVPELPADPALYANCIAAAGYFESVRLTEEDRLRTRQYQANAERATARASTTDLEGYLRSLDMELRWRRFDAVGLPRIVQLINKTNQFNLTTRRVTEEEATAMMADPRRLTLQLRLLDRFGDNGMIAVVIGRLAATGSADPPADMLPADMLIETWLMSCRVLGRGVEEATLGLIAAEAERLGAGRLIGEYRPTAKNGMVREHYLQLGFAPLSETPEDVTPSGITRWALTLRDFTAKPVCMRITGE
jgi:FkbH-like protein